MTELPEAPLERAVDDFVLPGYFRSCSPTATTAVFFGALGAMLPDPLQTVHELYPREPLRSLQRFHVWSHTKQRLNWLIGVSSQLSFIVLVVVTAGEPIREKTTARVQFKFINVNLVEATDRSSHFQCIATSAFVFLGHARV